jgi:hypothetical protein
VREDIRYIIDKYGSSSSFYRDQVNEKLPVMYFYDSYLIPSNEWATIFDPNGEKTIRNTPYDIIALGLYLNEADKATLTTAHFDGLYTYFAAEVTNEMAFCFSLYHYPSQKLYFFVTHSKRRDLLKVVVLPNGTK